MEVGGQTWAVEIKKVQDEHWPVPCTHVYVRTSASVRKFSWRHEQLLEGKQAEHFPAHICKAHGGGQILKEDCPVSYMGKATSLPQWLCQHLADAQADQIWCGNKARAQWRRSVAR